MKKVFLLCCVAMFWSVAVYSKTIYSCFLSQDYNMETGKVANQVTNNSLIDIILDGNKLFLGNKTYSLYNGRQSNSGFVTIMHYDGIDGQGQRCQIKFVNDASADWTTRNAIIIWYNELGNTAKWYQSRDPQQR